MTFSCCKERRRRRQPLVSPESQFLPRFRSYDRQAQEPRPCAETRAAHISLQKTHEPWFSVGSHHTEHPYRAKPLLGCGAPRGARTAPTTCTAERSPCCYGNISDISGTGGLLQSSPPWGFWVCFFIKSKFCSCSYFCEVLFSKHH